MPHNAETWERMRPTVERAMRLGLDVCGADACDLVVPHADTYRRIWNEEPVALDYPAIHWIIQNARPFFIPDTRKYQTPGERPNLATHIGLKAFLGVPVVTESGEVIGSYFVGWKAPVDLDAPRMIQRVEEISAFIADAYDRLLVVEALRAQKATAKALSTSMPLSLMMTDRDTRVLEATPRWLADFDVDRDEVLGQRLYDFRPAHFEKFRSQLDRCLAGETVKVGRVRLPAVDGVHHWLQAELTPWFTEDGEIGGIIGAATDITDTIHALERAERGEERLRLATEIAELHVWEVDYEKQTLETTGARETFFDENFDQSEIVRDTNVTIDPRDRDRISREWAEAVQNDVPYVPEYRINRSDGKEVWAACRVTLVKDEDGQPIRLLGAMQNITARKESERALTQAKEAAEAANDAKSAFLATMSHEIRTPLNGVLGMAQAMAQGNLDPVQRERLDVVRQSGEALLAILNDVLDMAKIESRQLELEEVEFDMGMLMNTASATFAALLREKPVSLTFDLDPEAVGAYRGDPMRVRQILYNLLSNAVKFTGSGEVRVTLHGEAGGIRLSVTDTGIGMSQSELARLFVRFAQADASTTRRFGGTGLGLAIASELTTMMGGTLTAESQVGVGSTFTTCLPLERVFTVQAPASIPAEPETCCDSGSLRVLAAEDNAVNQVVLRTLLEQIGVEVTVVGNGAEAIAAWREVPWDVILMDVQMPVMDGLSATREIRAAEALEGRARTPIIALTANAMTHQVAEYRSTGMDGHIAKPIDVRALYEALDAIAQALPVAQAA